MTEKDPLYLLLAKKYNVDPDNPRVKKVYELSLKFGNNYSRSVYVEEDIEKFFADIIHLINK